jgi:translation initiation factor 1
MRLFEGTQFDIPPRCERCGELEQACQCPEPEPECAAPESQTAQVSLEKRKKGKQVTLVSGLAEGHPGRHYNELLTRLKNACGAGGTIQAGSIEIQGDHRERIAGLLKEMGFKIR